MLGISVTCGHCSHIFGRAYNCCVSVINMEFILASVWRNIICSHGIIYASGVNLCISGRGLTACHLLNAWIEWNFTKWSYFILETDINFPAKISFCMCFCWCILCSCINVNNINSVTNVNNLYICTRDISTYCTLESDYNLMELGCKIFTSTGCCFVKFATSEEADRAIRALHNQVTLPGVSSILLVWSIFSLALRPPLFKQLICGFSRDWVPFKLDMLMENVNALVIFQVLFDLST